MSSPPTFLTQHVATLPSEIALESIEYMDDVAQPVFGHASQLCSKVALVGAVFQRTFAVYGLKVNWSKGKSEAIVLF